MKTFYYLILSILIPFIGISQTTINISLTDGNSQGLYISNFPDWENQNLNPDPDFAAIAWTSGGTPYLGRSLADFDLSVIPENAIILEAKISLFANPFPEHSPGHSDLSGPNTAYLKKVLEPWDENTTTWNTQPATTDLNQVTLNASHSPNEDYLNIDVTDLVIDKYHHPNSNFGFMLQLKHESYYRALNFASDNCSMTSKVPVLEITYTLDNCISIPVNYGNGQDLYISNFPGWENQNLNPDPDFAAIAWTSDGIPYVGRSLINFDLGLIPEDAVIKNAFLNLSGNPTPEHSPGHSTLSGTNKSVIKRVISPWDEYTTTWNTQPFTTDQNLVYLEESTSEDQDYYNIDVTELVLDAIDDPQNSFGFMLKLLHEEYYRSLNFASSNTSDTNLIPELIVCFENEIVFEEEEPVPSGFNVYPNPTTSIVNINFNDDNFDFAQIEIFNSIGQKVFQKNQQIPNEKIDLSGYERGVYIFRVSQNNEIITRNIILQ